MSYSDLTETWDRLSKSQVKHKMLCLEHFVSFSLYTFTDNSFLVPRDFLEFGKKEKKKKKVAS